MDEQHERQEVDNVIDRLAGKFDGLTRDQISLIVAEEHQRLDGNPIRDYVPVLVERAAKDRIRRQLLIQAA